MKNLLPAADSRKRPVKIFLCALFLAAAMILCTACGNSQEPAAQQTAAQEPAEESRPEPDDRDPAMTYYTVKEYLDKAPRIMVIDKPGFITKNGTVDRLYIIADGTITVKRTVPTSSYQSLDDLQKLDGEGWASYLQSVSPATYGELAKMSMDELWAYASALETEKELPLTLLVKTDGTGNRVVWEEIGDLSYGLMMYVGDGEAEWNYQIVYDKYFTGYSVLMPRERNGFYFISDEQLIITLDGLNTPGVQVD